MIKAPNEKNERLKRQFQDYRTHARQLANRTADRELAAIERFDVWNGRKDFAKFHIEQAIGFRAHLHKATGKTGKPLSKSTLRGIMATLREFILWLSQQDGFRSKIKIGDADYFRLSNRDDAEARAAPERPAPSMNQAHKALSLMPKTTPRQKRDKAVFALLCLTGIRVAALASLQIKHVDLIEKSIAQNPREVATKSGKSIYTFFAKGFDEAERALADWMTYLDNEALYSPNDPLFPATAIKAASNAGFSAQGFERRPWTSGAAIRKIVKTAFDAAGVPNYGPHAFRHMLARHTVQAATSPAQIVAIAQNLGHSDVLTTLRNYGQISRERQRELITGDKADE